MTKTDMVIVKKALKILENEFFESDTTEGYKPFLFMGTRKQAKSFYANTKNSDIIATLEQDKIYSNVWSVTTEEVDFVKYDNLVELKNRTINTVRE